MGSPASLSSNLISYHGSCLITLLYCGLGPAHRPAVGSGTLGRRSAGRVFHPHGDHCAVSYNQITTEAALGTCLSRLRRLRVQNPDRATAAALPAKCSGKFLFDFEKKRAAKAWGGDPSSSGGGSRVRLRF